MTIFGSTLLGAALALVITTAALQAHPLDNWNENHPPPDYDAIAVNLNAVIFVEGIFVAVGEDGIIATSISGINWTVRDSGADDDLYDITHGDGQFIAAGDFGAVLVSTDAVNWTLQPAAADFLDIRGVAYGVTGSGAGTPRIVVVGEEQIWNSNDNGLNWILRWENADFDFDTEMHGVAFGINNLDNTLFVAVGHDEFYPRSMIRHGQFGTGFTVTSTQFGDELHRVRYIDGLYIAVGLAHEWEGPFTQNGWSLGPLGGLVRTSPRGSSNWSRTVLLATDTVLRDVAHGNGLYVLVGDEGALYTSPNAVNWTQRDPQLDSSYRGVAFGNGRFVAVGEDGAIITSTNAIDWDIRGFNADMDEVLVDLRGITQADGLHVAVGDWGSIWTSPDARAWDIVQTVENTLLNAVTFGNGTLVAAGFGLVDGPQDSSVLLSSANARDWVLRHTEPGEKIKGLIFAEGKFVAVGSDSVDSSLILTSPDGASWTRQPLPGQVDPLSAVAYGNGLFVAVGAEGKILTSPDGAAWTARSSGIEDDNIAIAAIAYGNGRFVAAADDGIILISVNGIDWIEASTDIFEILFDMAFGSGVFVAVGEGGAVLSSKDGISWTPHESNSDDDLYGVSYANGSFIAVGDEGRVVQSGVLVSLASAVAGQLQLSGPPDRSYRIEHRDSLSSGDWQTLIPSLVLSTGTQTITVEINQTTRYYRAVLLE